MSDAGVMDQALGMAMAYLNAFPHPGPAEVQQAVNVVGVGLAAMGSQIDADLLRRRLEANVNVYIGSGSVLDDHDLNHRPWLDARRAEVTWEFWSAYREWLTQRLPRDVVRSLDQISDDILGRLEDPQRDGRWDRRGMVVGQVQSGKTSNYTALICKAADAGYRFIVVLAGLHNSLRSQTQRRLDEGFLGLDSRTSFTFTGTNTMSRAIGVGRGGRRHPPAWTLTSSDEGGDFARGVAGRIATRIGSDPVLLVVKKHKTILRNLIAWVTQNNGHPNPDTGKTIISDFPILVIDDEADNASVNTKKIEVEHADDGTLLSETDPSAINALIRRLLNSFERSALVSYTATPFANIFIDGEAPSAEHGEDLFPRSFIVRIPAPTNYIGPAEVFGVPAAEDPGGLERPGIPVLRSVDDHDSWLPTGHRKEYLPGSLPLSLRRALRSFLLVCACRAARGQTSVHNSMLVHVTRYVDVQARVREQLDEELEILKDGLLGRGGAIDAEAVFEGFRRLWEEDYVATANLMPPSLRGTETSWSEVRAALPAAAGRVRILAINGSARDSLEYTDHPDGISVVAVGGDKLSRGLTLEGLSVSYYLRASKMYDTLMQMGRWFGYREGYADLVRLYTTDELQSWYRDITIANEELAGKFDEMARVGSNPRDFSLYVRKSPAGLLVTAQAKMRSGRTMQLTFSDDVIETIGFRRDPEEQRANLEAIERFLLTQTAAGRRSDTPHHPAWIGVGGADVAGLLEGFRTVEGAKKARGALLARYVRFRVEAAELTEWTVVAVHNSKAQALLSIAGEDIGLTYRAYYKGGSSSDIGPSQGDYSIRRLGDQEHEVLDLAPIELQEAETRRRADHEARKRKAEEDGIAPQAVKQPSLGPYARKVRPATRGLLVIYLLDPGPANMPDSDAATHVPTIPGFMVSFPVSPGAPTIEYVVPERYWEREAT